MEAPKIKILLVDDHKIFREALRMLLDKNDTLEVIGESDNGAHAIELTNSLLPDVVFMDITLEGKNGIETTREIKTNHPYIKVVCLSSHTDTVYIADMIAAGASGYITKKEGIKELMLATSAVRKGKNYISPSIANVLTTSLFSHTDGGRGSASLTRREQQVLRGIAAGQTSGQIASDLEIALGTVDVHRRNLMRKLELHSAVELTRYAINIGLIS